MIKQSWNLNIDEKLRILSLHETATKNLYLIKEQTVQTKSLEPKKFVLPNNSFGGGKYLNFDRAAVDGVINQLNQYLKGYPQNQKINVEVEASESKVTNYDREKFPSTGNAVIDYSDDKKMPAGSLSKLRGETLKKYLETKLPKNVSITIKDLGAQGPDWKIPQEKTPSEVAKLANDPKYTQYQYVSFNIVGSGESQEEICDLGFSIIVDYRKEWCRKDDDSKCHRCNNAVFRMWANGIQLTTKDGDVNINLNNDIGSDKSGPSVVVELVVSKEQKKLILEENPEEILITYGCALEDCHSDPAHVTILNSKGQVLLPGTFLTTGNVRMSNKNAPVKLLKLDKCGKVISVAGQEGMEPDIIKPTPKVKRYKIVDYGKSLYELYQLIGSDGLIRVPQDKAEYFKYVIKQINGKTWDEALDALGIEGWAKRDFKKYLKSLQSGQ